VSKVKAAVGLTPNASYHMSLFLCSFDSLRGMVMVLVSPETIASVMALVPIPHSFAELDEMVAKGLPKGVLKASIDRIYEKPEDRNRLLYRIIPAATYKRRRALLSAEESERAERLARIFATTTYVWKSEQDARLFLTTPHSMLQGRSPLDVSMSELGARRVEELLWRLYYGIAA
jgi:putative toxin-antitoxin system antitoxin component (TIGR02293 family)